MTNSTALLGLALGMRHGTDSDHLTAIDGLSRLRPRAWNGVLFALGHGLVVTSIAAGIGTILADRLTFLGPWLLIGIGFINVIKLIRRSPAPAKPSRPIVSQPILLGMLLAAGFETSSQLSALVLAGRTNAWLLGALFSLGMVVVDGIDGFLAASTVRLATSGQPAAKRASRWLGILVVMFSFGLGGAELLGVDLATSALPLGLGFFAIVIGVRIYAKSGSSGDRPEVDEARERSYALEVTKQEVVHAADV